MSQWLMLEFTCPDHGAFEHMIDKREGRPAVQPCPKVIVFSDNMYSVPLPERCSEPSPVVTAYAVSGRVKRGEATQGKNGPPPANALSTMDLADGMPRKEWDKRRREKIKQARVAEIKSKI